MTAQHDQNILPYSDGEDVPAPYLSMASFLAALREGDSAAVRSYYLMFAPLLRHQARRMSVSDDERSDLVTTVLSDVLLHVQETDLPPRGLARYLVGSLRNRARNAHRDRERRSAREARAYSYPGDGAQRIVAECHSEYGIRSAIGTEADSASGLGAAIEKLAAFSAQALGPDDSAMMVGLSHHVPLRDLAVQMGISYGAARVRVHRLRERFLKLARQHVASLEPMERREMERFFRRAGVALDTKIVANSSPLRAEPTPAPSAEGEEK